MPIIELLLNLIYPNKCVFCAEPMSLQKTNVYICQSCMDKLKFCIKHKRCTVCGIPLQNPMYDKCSDCHSHTFSKILYKKITAVFEYDENARNGIIPYKRALRPNSANTFAALLSIMIKNDFSIDNIDIITAVPPRRERMKEFRFDQSGWLTAKISAQINIKYIPNMLKRVRDTEKQTNLHFIKRYENLKNSFGLNKHGNFISGKVVLVIDDVTTTGATFSECARVLKDAGAKEVYCAAIATTVKH